MKLNLLLALGFTLALSGASMADEVPMGVVEGFYGEPWSHQDRLDMIEFMGRQGLDLFIYAPKDDPRHRADWRSYYTMAEMREFRELVSACQENGVDFCFAVSPGGDMVYSSPTEQRLLLDKMMALHADGVTHFALFLDDIDVNRMGDADRRRFRTAAEAQMYLANALHEQILAREPDAWFLICPTVYAGVGPTEYWDTLRETLDEDIAVVWTGPVVISPTIGSADLDAITEYLGRPPFIWDNYPVNDFFRNSLWVGPIIGREPDIAERISGYAANPMNEAHASMIALATVADMLQQGPEYDPETSWERALAELGGDAADDLRIFAEQCRTSRLNQVESRELNALLDAYFANPNGATSRALMDRLNEVEAAAERLPSEIDPALADDMAPQIDAVRRRASAMRFALHLLDGHIAEESIPTVLRHIREVREIELNGAREVSERLFETAVGVSAGWLWEHRSAHEISAIDPPLEGRYDGNRGPDQLNIYTPEYGRPTTGTNPFGVEVTVVDGFVVSVGGNDSPIPPDGFIVSGHGESRTWIENNLSPGTPVTFDDSEVQWGEIPADRIAPEQFLASLRRRALTALPELLENGAPESVVRDAREVRAAIDETLASDQPPAPETLKALGDRVRALEERATWTHVEGGVVRGDVTRPRISLIFTGGDWGEGTESILNTLGEFDIKASLFVTGAFTSQESLQPLLRRAVEEGHYLGPHSDSHPLYCPWDDRSQTLVSQAFFENDIRANIRDLQQFGALHEGEPIYFIPPYEWYNRDQTDWADSMGMLLFNFSAGSGSNRDYAPEGHPSFVPSQAILDDILAFEESDPNGLNGFLLLLHLGSQREDKMHPLLRPLIEELRARGYEFVRIDEMLPI